MNYYIAEVESVLKTKVLIEAPDQATAIKVAEAGKSYTEVVTETGKGTFLREVSDGHYLRVNAISVAQWQDQEIV